MVVVLVIRDRCQWIMPLSKTLRGILMGVRALTRDKGWISKKIRAPNYLRDQGLSNSTVFDTFLWTSKDIALCSGFR